MGVYVCDILKWFGGVYCRELPVNYVLVMDKIKLLRVKKNIGKKCTFLPPLFFAKSEIFLWVFAYKYDPRCSCNDPRLLGGPESVYEKTNRVSELCVCVLSAPINCVEYSACWGVM